MDIGVKIKMVMKMMLIVFLKYPEEGKVKTRLAKNVGSRKAAHIYKELVEKTLTQTKLLSNKEINIVIAYCPKEKEQEIKEWISYPYIYHPQDGKDLGEKLSNSVNWGFQEGANKVVIIGTDCPGITPDIIEEAFQELSYCDIVLGPAVDGGYYLIGLSKKLTFLFEGINWSTPQVLKETIKKIHDAGFSYKLLRKMYDIDLAENYEHYLSYRHKELKI